jgi:hypothetical protein
MKKTVKIEEEFTKVELAHILDALITWENTVNDKLDEQEKSNPGMNSLLGSSFGSVLVHDIKIKMGLINGMEKDGIICLNK